MSNRAVTEAVDKVEAADELEHVSDGFDNGLAWKRVRFRGVTYKLVELEIGEHNKIEDLAKETKTDTDGVETEFINVRTQNRLMMEKSIVEPKGSNVGKMGTRLYGTLLRVMQDMHYTPEVDELRGKKKPEGDEKPGN